MSRIKITDNATERRCINNPINMPGELIGNVPIYTIPGSNIKIAFNKLPGSQFGYEIHVYDGITNQTHWLRILTDFENTLFGAMTLVHKVRAWAIDNNLCDPGNNRACWKRA